VPAYPPVAQPLPPASGIEPSYRAPHRVTLPPGPLPAIEREFEPRRRRHGPMAGPVLVGMGPTFAWRRDPGYALVTAHDRSADFDMFASYDVLAPTPFLVVAAGLDYRRFAAFSRDGDIDEIQHLLMADLTARLRFTKATWIAPHARVGFGLSRSVLQIDDEHGAAATVDEHDTGWATSFGGGFTLRTPGRTFETRGGNLSSLSFGILVEAGYTLAPAADFRTGPSKRNGISRASVDLGSLDVKAPYLRLGVVARF
jgi:hypothetical protein